jgi:hypothetical protein
MSISARTTTATMRAGFARFFSQQYTKAVEKAYKITTKLPTAH